MKVVITGGGGFIGRAVVEHAQRKGWTAEAFDRTNGQDIMGPLDAMDGADAVIHLAGVLGTAELFDTPHEAIDINIHGSLRVMEKCLELGAGYVGITMPQVFPSIYTATKVCTTRLATALHLAKDLPVSHVRAFNAYGPGQHHGPGHPQKIVPTFATEAWAGRPIPIWGDGEAGVDLIHTDDLARMLLDAVSHGDDVTFDGGTGQMFTVNEVAQMVLDVTGSTAGIKYLPKRDGEPENVDIVATGEGWDRLDWHPAHSPALFEAAVVSYRS